MTPSKNRSLGSLNPKIPFFLIWGIWSQISPILWRIWKGKWHLSKTGFWAWARAGRKTQHAARRDQSFYPQIPFSSQPQFREPINQGCGGGNNLQTVQRNKLSSKEYVNFLTSLWTLAKINCKRLQRGEYLAKHMLTFSRICEHWGKSVCKRPQRGDC